MARTAKPWFNAQTGWWTVWFNGKRHRLAEGKSARKAAQQAHLDLLYTASHNPPPEAPEQTVVSVIERYLSVALPSLSDQTRFLRTMYLQSFAEMHGWREVNKCRPDHLQEWVLKNPQWVSDWTKRDAVSAVQIVFNWAKAGLIPTNPFAGFRHRRGLPRRDITEAEFRAILRTTASKHRKKLTPGARFRQVLIFLWRTGARPAEASQLEWSHVDLKRGIIVLQQHKTVRSQRIPEPRLIPLDPVVVRLLEFIKNREEGDRVFVTHRLTPWTKDSLGHRVRRARELAGLPDDVKLYGVRHAFGTRGIIAGCDIKTLSVLMGHTDTKMTEHYAHIAGKRDFLASAMQQINRPKRRGSSQPTD
jgi:integrase